MLKANPFHPSLHFKKIGQLWSVRVGLDYRALGLDQADTVQWFWIGHHDEYDRLMQRGIKQSPNNAVIFLRSAHSDESDKGSYAIARF